MGNAPSSSKTSYSIPSHPFNKHGTARSCFRAIVVLQGRRKLQTSTTLMQLILLKDWQRVLIRAALFPQEIGKACIVKLYGIHWKLLPLHLACALKPPAKVIDVLLRQGLASQAVERRRRRFRFTSTPSSWPSTILQTSAEDRKELLSQRELYGSLPDESSVSTRGTHYSECQECAHGKGSLISLEQSIGDKSITTPTIDDSTVNKGTSLCSFLDKTGIVLQLTELGGVTPMPVEIPHNDTDSTMTDTKLSLELAQEPLLRAVAETPCLLPVHIACLYQASPSVIQLLLQAYPMGALSAVVGMLPVHLVAGGWTIGPIESSHAVTPLIKPEEGSHTTQARLRVMLHEFPELVSAKSANHGMSPLEYIEESLEAGPIKDGCLEVLQRARSDVPTQGKAETILDKSTNSSETIPAEIHCLSSLTASTTVATSGITSIAPESTSMLYNLFLERNWQDAMNAIEADPKLAREWQYGIDHTTHEGGTLWKRLALHLACSVGAPVGLVDMLMAVYPDAVGCSDPHNGTLPLHLACQFGAPLQVIRSLVQARTASTKALDARGRLPLHLAILSAAAYTTIELLVQHDPSSVLCPDQEGKTPLQYAHYSYPEGSPVVGLLEVVWM